MQYASPERKRLLHDGMRYSFCIMTPNQRLRQARELAGFETAVEAADALGVPRSTYIGHENGHRGFPASRAPQYARKFKVSEEWLLFGKGNSALVDVDQNDAEVVDIWDHIPFERRSQALEILRTFAEQQAKRR